MKSANDYKHNEFEAQLADNKHIRTRYDQELQNMEFDNQSLRDKIQKLEELNRSEVVNIEGKYRDIQKKDTTELISGHVNEIKTLIGEIDKLNWLIRDKNGEIQNLIRDRKEQKVQEEERELSLRAEIDTLKNKLEVQSDKAAQDSQEQSKRINSLATALQRDSEAYHDRVNQLNQNVGAIESELKSKENELDRVRAENNLKVKEQRRIIEDVSNKLDKTKRDLSDC